MDNHITTRLARWRHIARQILLTLSTGLLLPSAAWGQIGCELYADASATQKVGLSEIIFTLSWISPNPGTAALGEKIAEFAGTAHYAGGSAPYAKCDTGVSAIISTDHGLMAFDKAIFPWPSSSTKSRAYEPHGTPTGLGFKLDSATFANQGQADPYFGTSAAGMFGASPVVYQQGSYATVGISKIDWLGPSFKTAGSIKLGVYKIGPIPAGTVIEPGLIGHIQTYHMPAVEGGVVKLFNVLIDGAQIPLFEACQIDDAVVNLDTHSMSGPVGSVSATENFFIQLRNCPTGVALKYRVDPAFGIAAPGSDNSLMALEPGGQTASGVAIQLLYGNGMSHPLSSDISLGVLPSSSHAISLGARYKKIESVVNPGDAQSSATVTVDYQ